MHAGCHGWVLNHAWSFLMIVIIVEFHISKILKINWLLLDLILKYLRGEGAKFIGINDDK